MAKNGKIILKDGRPYWVEGGVDVLQHQEAIPTDNKMIPFATLTKQMKNLLSDGYKFLHMPEYYKRKDFLEIYQEFHTLTGNKYIEGGFDKFRVACSQARKKGY